MANRSRALAVAAVIGVVVIAVGLWWWRVRSGPPPLPEPKQITVPDAIPVQEVALSSPDLEVILVGMRGTVHPDYTDWACLLECREPKGCRADVRMTVEYRSAGQPQKLVIDGRLNGAPGEVMRVGRVQRPPVTVDAIDRVSMTVLQVHRADAPRPTEIE